MCDKALNSHPCTMQFVPECYKSQEMCDKAVNRSFFVFNSIPDHYKTQEICDIIVYFYPFLKIYCPDKYRTQKMCNEAVDDCLAALKFITDWFVTSKMLGKFDNTFMLMMIYSFIMKIVIKSHLLLIKNIFLL